MAVAPQVRVTTAILFACLHNHVIPHIISVIVYFLGHGKSIAGVQMLK